MRIDLRKVRQQGRLREWKVQDKILDSTLSRSSFYEECLISESKRGAPNYFEGRVEEVKPKMRELLHLVIVFVLKKKICEFSRLIVVPEALEKVRKMSRRAHASWTEGFLKRILSYTNC